MYAVLALILPFHGGHTEYYIVYTSAIFLSCTSYSHFSQYLHTMSEHKDVDALFEDDPGSLDGVIDEDDAEDLKLDDVNTKVWLVKVPKFLAEKWRSIDEDNVNLGSIRIYNK